MKAAKAINVFNRIPHRCDWWSLKTDGDTAEIMIYDEIAWYAVDAQELVTNLGQLNVERIDVRLNTPGGSVFDGLAIYNALKAHPAHVVTHIDGLAASIGSVIALAGDEVRAADNAFFMIHDPWVVTVGNAADLRDVADVLDKIGGSIQKTYIQHSTLPEEDIRNAMQLETWYTAEEAHAAGFVDQVVTAGESAQARFDLSMYQHAPALINAGAKPPQDKREFEGFLRDAGYSRKAAKAFTADGFDDSYLRDADTPPPAANLRDAGSPIDETDDADAIAIAAFNLKLRAGM